MPYLIDGHNLIGQTPGLRLDDPDDEQKLVTLLRTYLTRIKKKGAVIFDKGQPGETRSWSNARLEVKFAPAGKTADEVIKERMRREKNPSGIIVVTSDRNLAAMVKRAGAEVLEARAFARAMLAPPPLKDKKEKGLQAEEVAEWEEIFKHKPEEK